MFSVTLRLHLSSYMKVFFIETQAVIKITSNFDRSGLHQLRLEQTVVSGITAPSGVRVHSMYVLYAEVTYLMSVFCVMFG